MPLPKPHKGESQSDFMARCMHEAYGSGAPSDRTQEQAVAMCFSAWREEHGGSPPKTAKQRVTLEGEDMDEGNAVPAKVKAKRQKEIDESDLATPDEDEDYEDFMDRCVTEYMIDHPDEDEDEVETACEVAWAQSQPDLEGIMESHKPAKVKAKAREEYEGSHKPAQMKHKTHSESVQGMEFVLSDETPDRLGDVIVADGWVLDNFNKNPIALFNHNANFPIGRWRDLRVEGNSLRGHLEMAPKGTSDRIDEIRKLIDVGILRAVSVGFRDVESEPINEKDPWGGKRFIKQELVETSLVSVPANPNALAIAKSLSISPTTMDLVFAKHGNKDEVKRRRLIGKHAKSLKEGGSAMSLSQRISDVEAKLVERRDKLTAHLERVDDSNVSDTDLQVTVDLNAEIAQLEKQHTALVESEKLLANTSNGGNGHVRPNRALAIVTPGNGGNGQAAVASPPIITGSRRKELDPIDYLVRSAVVAIQAKSWGKMPDETRQKIYGDDDETKVVNDLILRAASAPAMTTVAGWAAELVQQKYTDLMPLLMPAAILTRLSGMGLVLSFGATGRIIIPTRNRTPTIAGSFVGEGAAIPVRQGAFSSQTLTPKKMAVISTWTREMSDHSTPAIEGLIREAIQVDTSVAVDTVLIDANPATTIRPAGLLNGVSATTATAGGGIAALIGDLTALLGALTTNTYGNVRSPAFLVNPTDMLRASLLQAANTGIFPFQTQIAAGRLNGVPLIDSSTVPAKTMILVDAADFVVVGGEAPRMEISDQATLHMEDTAPLDLVSGSPGTVASPQRSLFQTDSLALRMVMPLNWVQRRTGTIAWVQNVTW
jgi:HK97 family phage prohead protease